jgi:uncharacterized RDD family membrane protein YckC
MKCPKCGYLGFEHSDSCRNCGYEFVLASAPSAELPLRSASPDTPPVDDLALSLSDGRVDLDRVVGTPDAVSESSELPLFESSVHDDEPLIKTASAPRAPLAVRRSTPEVPRLRTDPPRAQSLLDELEPPEATASPVAPPVEARRPVDSRRRRSDTPEWVLDVPAGLMARLSAVLIDLVLLAAVDMLVIYFTVQICGLTLQDVAILPKGPLIAFLLVQNGGYLVAFTAGGQTIGKMATGIRVISAVPDSNLDVGKALLRELMWLLLAVPAGLGFVSALFDRERRGLHDRFAGTRVVVD